VDSTGLETRHVSTYFSKRCGRKYHRYPKLSAVVDINSHLFLSAVIDRGPKPDDLEFRRVVRQAHRRQPFGALLGHAGYDGDSHHRFLYRKLGVVGVIPPKRGRPSKDRRYVPHGFFRSALAKLWPVAEYGQRWQAETLFSMLKRLLGSALRNRRSAAIDREILLRVLTINLMILLCLLLRTCFQRTRAKPLSSRRPHVEPAPNSPRSPTASGLDQRGPVLSIFARCQRSSRESCSASCRPALT